MPSLSVRLDQADLSRINRRISHLLQAAENLEPVWQKAAEYMVRATKNRILREKRDPRGERWAALSEVTKELKGSDSILFETGSLARGIQILDVSHDGFMVTSEAPHSSWMQRGKARQTGFIKSNRPVPARPFMGFSDENVRRISKMVRDYINNGGE
jgi:phage virion morphogenesis protein